MLTYHPSIVAGEPAEKPKQHNPSLEAARAKSELGPRRMHVMSQVFFALERRGGSVEGNEDSAAVTIGNQRLVFRVVEKLRQVKVPPTEFDQRWKTASFKRGYNVRLEPTGILRLEIETYLRGLVKQVWQEEALNTLERIIEDFADAMCEGAEVRQAWDDELQAEEVAKEVAAARRLKAAHEERVDKARWDMLVKLATDSSEAQLVSAFVASLMMANSAARDTLVGDRTLGDWLDWLDAKLEQKGMPRSPTELFQRVYSLEDNGPQFGRRDGNNQEAGFSHGLDTSP